MLETEGEDSATTLTAEQARLLALMRADNLGAAEPFTASEYWLKINRRFAKEFDAAGITDIGTQAYNRLFSTPGSVKFQRYAMWMLYSSLRSRDEHHVLDRISEAALPGDAVEFGTHRVTWDTLISLDTLCSLAELDPSIWTEPVVVADLGSGWGRIGHVLKIANPLAAYVALDLPESLLIASSVLPTLVAGASVHTYDETRQTERFSRDSLLAEAGIYFCGSHQLERFAPGSIDFFVNVASFQEMTPLQVELYLSIAGRTSRLAYLQQRWKRPPSLPPTIISGLDEYPFDPGWQQDFLRPTRFSDVFFEAGFTIQPSPATTPQPRSG